MSSDNCFYRSIEGHDLAIDSSLTNAAGYQLSVLRSKVKYYDCFVLIVFGQKENLWTYNCVKDVPAEEMN